MKYLKMLLQLVCLWCIMFAALGIIFAAGVYIAPECCMVALGLELAALIMVLEHKYSINHKAKKHGKVIY